MPAARRFRTAREYESEERWEEAERAYRAILAVDDRQARVFARLARVLERQRRWPEAADAYRAALARDSSRRKWRVRLAKALERVDRDEARRIYKQLLDEDPRATALDRRLLKADVRRFRPRRRYGRFVTRNLDEIRERAAAVRFEPPGKPPRIWVYWAQGIAHAPAVVRRCHDELMRYHGPDEVVVLDDSLVPKYVEIPEIVRRRTAQNPTKFADVLRLELLLRYGGIWLDATCFPRRRVLDLLPELLPSGFFAFRYRRARISSWFLASEPNNPVVAMIREAQNLYWTRFRRPIDYYVLHHLFESLFYLAEDFRDEVKQIPWRSSHPPARFARVMLEPYDPQQYERLLDGCFIHKLTYKYPAADATPDTLLGHLMRGE